MEGESTMAERNALAELAERLKQIAEVEREGAVFHGDPLNASDDIYTAQRIVAKLAKVESLYERMNAMAINGRIVEAEELAHELRLAEDQLLAKCRAIAEEGVNNGK